ncbi:DUF4199 domain-containing protein [Bacteroidales bacterium OttesenSCG-928-C03]|nr:DUF4199 domain-containing protein [Bacteroidales bacterium OttesenSCG-928-C03]MDL2326622.1 DUF4199 domain-containing protein [Bacteroidales bacterium OttesenSCG-928-A14]
MNKKLTIIIKWAFILGFGTSLLQIFKSFTRDLQFFSYGALVDLMLMLIFIGALYMGVKEYRDQVMDGKIKFTKAFSIALNITGVAFVVFFLCSIFQYSVIDKEGLARINARNQKTFIERVENDTVKTADLHCYVEYVNAQIDSSAAIVSVPDECQRDVKNRLIALKGHYELRLMNKNMADSGQLLLKNVDSYAQKTLIDLTEAVINERPMEESCSLILSEIILNTLTSVRSNYSILEKGIETSTITPRYYDNVVSAAFAFSISILLYGVLLGIFIALYLAKRENKQFIPKEEETKNDQN